MDYWNKLRRDLPLPQWEKFNIAALQDIWGQCCVWRVDISATGHGNQYTYEYVGSNAQEALGTNLTGVVFASHLQKFPAARITERIEETVLSLAPIMDEGSFVNQKNKVVKYRSCLLPFGTIKGKVTHVILGLSWRTF